MGVGITILFISGVWALILLIRVQSILGQKFLIISGNNIFDAKGIAISDGVYLLFWLIAIAGLCVGIWLIISSTQEKNVENNNDKMSQEPEDDEKKCPTCAEKIKLEALKCKHCGEVFNQEDIHIEREKRKTARKEKVRLGAYKLIEGLNGDAFCANCRNTSSINGMYHHRETDSYYHEKCLPK